MLSTSRTSKGKKLQKRADRPIGLVVLVALAAGSAVEAGLAVK